jgi:hypothetical protein
MEGASGTRWTVELSVTPWRDRDSIVYGAIQPHFTKISCPSED